MSYHIEKPPNETPAEFWARWAKMASYYDEAMAAEIADERRQQAAAARQQRVEQESRQQPQWVRDEHNLAQFVPGRAQEPTKAGGPALRVLEGGNAANSAAAEPS